jgi:hypothetical protein
LLFKSQQILLQKSSKNQKKFQRGNRIFFLVKLALLGFLFRYFQIVRGSVCVVYAILNEECIFLNA